MAERAQNASQRKRAIESAACLEQAVAVPAVPDVRPVERPAQVPVVPSSETAPVPVSKADPMATVKRTLVLLCLIYATGMLCFQAFNYVYMGIGLAIGAGDLASMITALPGSLLGIICFIYGGLGDFMSLKKMFVVGMVLLVAGSLGGFFLNFSNVWMVVIMRAIQTAGGQMPGSIYLILCARSLSGKDRVKYFGLFNAVYAAAAIAGLCCGGLLVSVGWQWLFAIPVVSVLAFVPVMRGLAADEEAPKQHVDVPGFTIFGIAISLLTFYFSQYNPVVLGLALVAFVAFAIYISKARDPFITPEFFKNRKWIMAICLLVVFYFYNHVFAPTYQAMGAALYGMSSASVSFMLIPGYAVWIIVAVNSGAIYTKLGRKRTALLSAVLLMAGFWSTAFVVDKGVVPLVLTSFLIFGGTGLVYSPYFDTVVGTVPVEESGRAVGMNDLAMNVSASIGVAVFTPHFAVSAASPAHNVIGIAGAAGGFSSLFLTYGLVACIGIVYYLVVFKHINTNHEPEPGERPIQ